MKNKGVLLMKVTRMWSDKKVTTKKFKRASVDV